MALKVINADQKAAHQKKPMLQAQLSQLEEQLAQHKKVDEEYRARLADQAKTLTEKFEKEKADLVAELTKKAEEDAKAAVSQNFLILTQFLRLAAARRVEDPDGTSDESMALEGVLLQIYSGDENAVAAMMKLVEGSDEQTRSTTGETLQTTCKFFFPTRSRPTRLGCMSTDGLQSARSSKQRSPMPHSSCRLRALCSRQGLRLRLRPRPRLSSPRLSPPPTRRSPMPV